MRRADWLYATLHTPPPPMGHASDPFLSVRSIHVAFMHRDEGMAIVSY